jgi:hypothetical protein
MKQDVINKIVAANSREEARRVLDERRAELLQGIGDRTIEPTEDVLGELFDLNLILGDGDFFTGSEQ